MRHGFAFRGEYFSDHGRFIVLTPGNFYDEGGFKSKSGIEKFYSAEPPDDYVLHRDDLVVAMTEQVQGLLGSSALIPEDGIYLHNQRIGLVELARDVDRRFIYYLFNAPHVRNQIQATATGSKIRHTAPSRIEAVEAAFPPLPIQRKIAAILCAYDALIENTNRRIKLLGDVAQRIYREWFVDFRYPGHAEVPMVNSTRGSIPIDWSMATLGDLFANVRDGVDAGTITAARPYVPIDCISTNSLALVNWKAGTAAASSLVSFARRDVLFGAMRPYFHKVALAPWEGTTRTTCLVLRARPRVGFSYAALTAVDERTIDFATSHSSGTTIPYARWSSGLSSMPVLMPSVRVMSRFEEVVAPMLAILTDAGAVLHNLQQTRDFLLPRLFSAEIDVEQLDIDLGEAAA